MFFKKSSAATAVLEPAAPMRLGPPAPISIEAELEIEERKAYAQLCREIGFRPAALIKDEFLALLQEEGSKTFPYAQVKKYLDDRFGKKLKLDSSEGNTWSWCPLRDIDRRKSHLSLPNSHGQLQTFRRDNGQFEFDRTYHGAVPFVVLDLVKKTNAVIPEIAFFVSDVMQARDRTGDPFLAATTPSLEEMIVCAVWDEPSFRP